MGLVRDAGYALEPGVWFLYSAPLVAFQPLLIVWLGFGFWTVVALAAGLATLPIAVNTQAGVRAVDPLLLRAVRAFGGGRWDEVLKVPGRARSRSCWPACASASGAPWSASWWGRCSARTRGWASGSPTMGRVSGPVLLALV